MSDCCNPVIPPACVNRCQQLYNACCVIDEQPLPCIFDPVQTTITSAIVGQFTFSVDSIAGLEVGMLVVGDAVGSGAVITNVTGLVVTVSIANVKNVPDAASDDKVSFLKIDNEQCDINKAVNDILCLLKEGGIPCPEWNDAELEDPLMDLNWTANSKTQYSDPLQCVVRLRGVIQTTIPVPVFTAILSQLFQIPVGPSRPAIQKVLSLNVVVNSDDQFTSLTVPANLTIGTDGKATLVFTNFNPLVARPSSCPDCTPGELVAKAESYFVNATTLTFFVPLDGLTFETQS